MLERREGRDGKAYESISDILFRVASKQTRKDIELFRKSFELAHGPTDLSRRYTSTWPIEQQEWLATNEPKCYFDGLPPFVQAYLRHQAEQLQQCGAIDNLPAGMIRLLVSGQLNDPHP